MLAQQLQPQLVVGVGASAGGLEAFKELLKVLPPDRGMTFLLVQHLDPTHRSHLTELLRPWTKMEVHEAEQGDELRPNTIYIIRPDTALAVRDGRIELTSPTLHRGVRLPVDHLFRSLAREYGPRSAAVILSGAGSDGSFGIRQIKAVGGISIAQDPTTSTQTGMPASAIDTGVVDLVLKIPEIPAALERFESLPALARIGEEEQESEASSQVLAGLSEEDIAQLAAVLETRAGFDLRVYKSATVERRVLRRMALADFESIQPYLEQLREDPLEQQTLIRDLLISVTDFFRDFESFEVLREMVIQPLVATADSGETIRVWVPACATGEEAYSIAIEFLEAIRDQSKRVRVQIFATDIDHEALAFARAGIYPLSIVDRIAESRLKAYFSLRDDQAGYQVRPALRDVVSFAAHDLTKDPPFSRMHLVSCRNVLIYLTTDAQKQVLKLLHFALEPQGHLLLSTSESTGSQKDLFTTISKTQRLYKKRGLSRAISVGHSRNRNVLGAQKSESGRLPTSPAHRERSGSDLARRAVVEAFAPPTLVVAGDGMVVFSHGELEPFVRIPQGDDPKFELNSILRPELRTRTRGALYKCRRTKESVTALFSPEDSCEKVTIEARPAIGLGDDAVILTFVLEAEGGDSLPAPRPESPGQEALTDQLERELQATREDLRSTVEELETSNEELRSSNEESMSMNEELQSANEELEATTEELRSVNEELTTVNAQLREKVDQLEQAHDDLTNFFASTKIATLFLDEQLRIKRFTPTAQELLNIAQADIGRRAGDIARELLQNDLELDAKIVLEHLRNRSQEIRTADKRWIARQTLPYRTENRRIEGVVITFVDITDLKSATERLELRERQQGVIAKAGLHALRETDLQAFMDQVVRDVQETLGTDFCKILELQPGKEQLYLRAGVGWQTGLVGGACVGTGVESQAGYTLRSSDPVIVSELAKEQRFSGPQLLKDHSVTSGVSCVIRDGADPYGVIGAHTREHREFTDKDAYFLQAMASVVGSAVARHQTRLRFALELGVAHVLADAYDLGEALERLLERVGQDLAGSVVELWWYSPSEGTLSLRNEYIAPSDDRDRVQKSLAQRSYAPGEGLVGLSFERQAALWCTDFGDPTLFALREGTAEAGLASGFGFPVRDGNEILGVVTVYSSNRHYADPVFLKSLDNIGRSLGDFVTRSEFEQRARRLAAITASSHDAILSYNLDGVVTEWLAGAERLFGYTTEEMLGQSIERIVPPEEIENLWRTNERVHRGELDEPLEVTRVCKDGRTIMVSLRSSPVRDRRGEVVGISSTDRDITRQKESERKLIEADRQKDEFLAMLGHELRNPLSAIRSAAELMKLSSDKNSSTTRIQGILERQSAHMAKLLDGLLDVSRIIRGKVRLEPEVLDLNHICRAVVSDVMDAINRPSLEIRFEIPDHPVRVDADPVRLTQIIDNLLSNAIKYTKDGGRISLRLEQQEQLAVLTIKDTGVGIEPDLLPHVFEVFRQSRQNLDRSGGGLGIGLALVKSLVEMHGGQVEARSEGDGKGSEFVVRLPTTSKELPTKIDENATGIFEILLVEDNVDSGELLKEGLELLGHRVTVATRAREGIELARERALDVVLCDIGLPDLSGYEVARELRAQAGGADLLLVAQTGYGRPDDKRRCMEAGFDAHLTKPLDAETISRKLSELRGHPSSHPPRPTG